MNRLKVWVYVLAVAAAAYVTLRVETRRLREAAMADLDARLAAASAQVLASTRAVTREASAVAALAARDERLAGALHAMQATPLPRKVRRGRPPPGRTADPEAQEAALREAARGALAAAERAMGFDLPDGTVITAGNRAWLARQGKASEADAGAMPFLRGAVAGKAQRGYVLLNGAVFHAAAAPAGDGAGLVVLAPADEAWVKALSEATGALFTLSVPDAKPISTAGAEARAFAGWNRGALPVDVGRLDKAPFALGPLKLPALPLPFGGAPAFRARAVPLAGPRGGFLVAAFPAAPSLGAIAQLHWELVLGIALVLVTGAVLGAVVRPSEGPAAVPEELLAAAARIERGDFGARAPPLAGRLGTIATALNRAAELAGPAAAAETARASVTDEFFAAPAARAQAPQPEPTPAPAPAAELHPPEAHREPTPPAEEDEETHFQHVYQDFLRTRASCGEPSEGLTYEKFRLKLDGNKAALVSKYGCRTVRFQVYVKDGKAALKATPVK